MADKTGDRDEIRDCFEEEYLQNHLEDIARNEDIANPKYRITLGSKKGDNYVSIVYRVVIDGEKNGENVQIHLVMKCAPQDEVWRRLLNVDVFFKREIFFYKEVVPAFLELVREHNSSITGIPIIYSESIENSKEVIVLEDLKKQGFVMRDRMKGLDYAHASLAIRHLGQLHAYSFALRDQKPHVFRKLTEMKETFFVTHSSEEGLGIPAEAVNAFGANVIVALAGEEPYYTERFKAFQEEFQKEMKECCNGNLAEPYAVINHGDFWTNNMLFKYNEGSSEPQKFYFLDFQVARYASPALDLLYMLFCCCNKELRSNHFDQLILDYHNSLSERLIELGSDPKRLFPFVALSVQLRKFGKFAAGMGMLTIGAFTAREKDIVTDFANEPPNMENRIHEDQHFRNTLRDAFKDIIDRNYI